MWVCERLRGQSQGPSGPRASARIHPQGKHVPSWPAAPVSASVASDRGLNGATETRAESVPWCLWALAPDCPLTYGPCGPLLHRDQRPFPPGLASPFPARLPTPWGPQKALCSPLLSGCGPHDELSGTPPSGLHGPRAGHRQAVRDPNPCETSQDAPGRMVGKQWEGVRLLPRNNRFWFVLFRWLGT